MQELFRILEERREKGKDSMLVSVVEGSGSIPRTAGAYMVVGEEGYVYGTIGGGNLEHQGILAGQKLLEEKRSDVREYNLSNTQVAGLGMVCGGHVKILFYYLDATDKKNEKLLKEALDVCRERKPYWLLIPLQEGDAKIVPKIDAKKHRLILTLEGEKEYYAEQFSYDGKVYIFGGGHLAQELVPVLSHVGFCCIVADDRDEFTRTELFPQAEAVVKIDFSQIEKFFSITQDDYIAVMTRGHLCDTDAERFALKTSAGYIGVVGSRSKTKYVREKLEKEGFSKEELDRVTAPIGLDIGSETPAEIAISIAAQLILFRAQKYE